MKTNYLTADDLRWLDFHANLAIAGDNDIAEFSKLFLSKNEPKKVKVYTPVVDDFEDPEDEDLKWADADTQKAALLKHCRQASYQDYKSWLQGYLALGSKVTHPRNWSFNPHDWYVVESMPDYIPELYGARSVKLIVPSHIKLPNFDRTFHGCSGHNDIFFMKGYTKVSLCVESFEE
jgi:hypothetical protein